MKNLIIIAIVITQLLFCGSILITNINLLAFSEIMLTILLLLWWYYNRAEKHALEYQQDLQNNCELNGVENMTYE